MSSKDIRLYENTGYGYPIYSQDNNTDKAGVLTPGTAADGITEPSADITLRQLKVIPISTGVAAELIEAHHYLHSFPGGTMLCLGVLSGDRLQGALTLGAGPFQGYCLVQGSQPKDCITLSRFWLADQLPPNSESWVLGLLLRALRRQTSLKFVLAYADQAEGHLGTIYQASNWLYTGLSTPMPRYDFGDGVLRHSRSTAHILGSHSLRHFTQIGLPVKVLTQAPKYRYIYFLDPRWKSRLAVPILPYPKEVSDGTN